MHPYGREDLPLFRAFGGVKGNPPPIIDSERGVEADNIFGIAKFQVPLERLEQLRPKFVGRTPERQIEIGEARTQFKIAQDAVGIYWLRLSGEPGG